jgi:hypothetical protein
MWAYLRLITAVWPLVPLIAAARLNADRVIALERRLGVFVEPRLVLHQRMELANGLYFWLHTIVLVLLIPACWWLARWYLPRLVLSTSWGTILGGGIAALWPVAPPRLMPGHGFVDGLSALVPPDYDAFAAFPSFHVFLACAVVAAVDRCRARWCWRLVGHGYALGMVGLVLVTGNHYVIDCLGGIALWWVADRMVAPLCAWAWPWR